MWPSLSPFFLVVVVVVAAVIVAAVLVSGRRDRRVDGEHTHRLCIAVRSTVSAPRMWAVVAELGNIQRYMPALRSSALLGGAAPGEGAIRACEDRRGRRWTERCVRWDPERGAGRSSSDRRDACDVT